MECICQNIPEWSEQTQTIEKIKASLPCMMENIRRVLVELFHQRTVHQSRPESINQIVYEMILNVNSSYWKSTRQWNTKSSKVKNSTTPSKSSMRWWQGRSQHNPISSNCNTLAMKSKPFSNKQTHHLSMRFRCVFDLSCDGIECHSAIHPADQPDEDKSGISTVC